jgi:spore germination cell wall hydrolase CwlJ-like protein
VNNFWKILGGIALVAILAFQQLEIATIHEDVQDIKAYIIKTNSTIHYTKHDEECLAKNIYHEAGVESQLGKFAVAQVTLNRLFEGRWGKNICSVVYSKSQFSWTLDRKKKHAVPRGPLWEESKAVAHQVLAKGYRVANLEDATYYHADYIKPPLWSRSVAKIQQIGQHIFYKKPYPV